MIAHVVAISKNNCIGKNGSLPWHLPEDMKHFKDVTMGHTVLMGRKTWESIPEKYRPLPGRKNIVITRQKNYSVPNDVKIYHNIPDAIKDFKNQSIMIIGGGQIYKETMNIVDTLYITHVNKHVDGDTFYPEINPATWMITEKKESPPCTFSTYKRI